MKGYGGSHGGVVTDNKDPMKLGRIKANVGILGSDIETEWAFPATALASPGSGVFWPPAIGAAVQIEFVMEDPEVPLYGGGYWAAPDGVAETPEEFQRDEPTNRGFKTPGGHLLEFDDFEDTQGMRFTTIDGFKIFLDDKNKKIVIETPGGQSIVLDDDSKQMLFTVVDDLMFSVAKNVDYNVGEKWTVMVTQDAKIEATGKIDLESVGKATLKGTAGTDVGDSASITNVNGMLVNLGGGGVPIALVGSLVLGNDILGLPVIASVVIGSTKVTSA